MYTLSDVISIETKVASRDLRTLVIRKSCVVKKLSDIRIAVPSSRNMCVWFE